MRTRSAVFLLFLLVALPCVAAAPAQPSEYATLLAALKAGNTAIDYTRLRLSFMDSPEYSAEKDTTDAEKAMGEALQANDFPRALKNAQTVLDNEYVNIDAHYVAYIANREMGSADKAQFHLTVFRALLDSIRNSGDGLSTEKAWVVISVHEEYVLLRALGFRPFQQSLLAVNGHSYDKMVVKNTEDGSEKTFYFNVDIPMKHEGI